MLTPPPPWFHAVSSVGTVLPLVGVSFEEIRLVPPTATTFGNTAGCAVHKRVVGALARGAVVAGGGQEGDALVAGRRGEVAGEELGLLRELRPAPAIRDDRHPGQRRGLGGGGEQVEKASAGLDQVDVGGRRDRVRPFDVSRLLDLPSFPSDRELAASSCSPSRSYFVKLMLLLMPKAWSNW